MDMIWQATLDGYVKLLYDNDPQGPLLESIRDFEKRFCQVAEENRGNPGCGRGAEPCRASG